MAKALVLQFENSSAIALELTKVDRSDLYGYVETETLDAKGRKCFPATLADDGQTLVGPGGSAFACLSPDGTWLEKGTLKAVDVEGRPLTPVPSSYAAPVPVSRTVSVDEYLSHNIRSVYQLSSQAAELAPLLEKLAAGVIFTFPYSYRGGLEPDTAFLLAGADGTPFLALGAPTRLDFIGFDQPAAVEEETSPEGEDDLDFGMM
jgi:hypothetical protein